MLYRYEARSLAGFIQQLAVSYVAHGYFHYVTGLVPERKDLAVVDAKLVERYDIGLSVWSKARRRASGAATMQYLRHGRFFVLVATPGVHRFFVEEKDIRDFRRTPLRHGGYSVSARHSTVTGRLHASVRIEQEVYLGLKARLLELALHRSVEALAREFAGLPFEPYAPVRRQFLNLLRAVNRERARAGYELVPSTVLRLRRRPIRVFGEGGSWGNAA
jgi:hypothetical protein